MTINIVWVSGCLMHLQWCQKIKQEVRSSFPCKFAVGMFSEFKLWSQQQFLDPNASVKKISIFQNQFNWAIEEFPSYLQLEVINLQSNDMLKDKYQQKNLIELYKCLSSSPYAQLKLLMNWYQYLARLSCVRRHFQRCNIHFWIEILSEVKSHYRSVLPDER